MSALDDVKTAETARRDAEAELRRAEVGHQNRASTESWSAVKRARDVLARTDLELKLARQTAEREEIAAGQAARKQLLDELARECTIVDDAWPEIHAETAALTELARKIDGHRAKIEAAIERGQSAASRARYLASEAAVPVTYSRIPTEQFARMLVRARLVDMPRDHIARWCASGLPHFQDPTRGVFDQAMSAAGVTKPYTPIGSDDAPGGWNDSHDFIQGHADIAEHVARGGAR